MKRRLLTLACTICLLFSLPFTLASCYRLDTTTTAEDGIVSASINEDGELIVLYRDGTQQSLGVVVGKDGKNGTNGIDGKDGKDGENGTNGADGKDGKDGKDGVNGADGADGKDGSLVITGGESSIPTAIAKAIRSTVSIVCKFEGTASQGGSRPSTQTYSSSGSGVIYEMNKDQGNAFIITNFHVVYDASSNTQNGVSDDICVYLYGSEADSQAIEATFVGGSLYYDIAVLSIEGSEILKASDACSVTTANSDAVSVGESAIAIGNAKSYGLSASSGIISVDSEYIDMLGADGTTQISPRVLRVDTAINAGNSGGGLFDGNGNLLGIVNAKIVDTSVENIGYAIPSNVAVAVAENILDYCYGTTNERVQRALLGVTVISSDSHAVYNATTGRTTIEETVSIYEISSGALADGVLQVGDVLVSVTINDQAVSITRQHHIIDRMLDARVGDTVLFNLLRDGVEESVSITITAECLTAY